MLLTLLCAMWLHKCSRTRVAAEILCLRSSFVELFVEHTNGEQEAIQIRRGVPAPSAHIPYGSYKVCQSS